MGVAGATLSNRAVIIAGLAGLVAGALSMALGEWISVQSSREMYESRLAALSSAFDRAPAATRARLVAMERARGLRAQASAEAGDRLMQDRERALRALASYELGIDYDDVGGSPWGAAAMAFLLFPAGAILSLIPFFFISAHPVAVIGSLCLAGVGLFAVGAAITRFTRRSVLYFYPKDDTSGCTKEATGFAEAYADFRSAGAEVVGISKDSVASHDAFKSKHGLPFPLASDQAGKVVEAYGSWVEKSMYGRTYMGIDRSTFLIDATGTIHEAWRKVKVPGHVEEVLAATRALAQA
ncbi:MAG: VIT1/CCC1 transporter family protein [Geminicoccaceae bacterium]